MATGIIPSFPIEHEDMAMPDDDNLLDRQCELERMAIGLGLDRASRMVSGERTQDEVDVFGGERFDHAEKKKRSLFYTIACDELPKLAQAIDQRRLEHGNKLNHIYSTIEQCGSAHEVAGIVIKSFFDAFSDSSLMDEDDDSEERGNISTLTLADDIVGKLLILQSRKKRNRNKARNSYKSKKTIKEKSKSSVFDDPNENKRLGLILINLYLHVSDYFMEYASVHGKALAFSNEAAEIFMEQMESENSVSITADPNAPEKLFEKGIVSPSWMPTLVKPVRWTTMTDGGYHGELSGQVSLVKRRKKISNFSKNSCPIVFDAINHLQETPFRINAYVHNVFTSLFKEYTKTLKTLFSNSEPYPKLYTEQRKILLDMPQDISPEIIRDELTKHWMPLLKLHKGAELFASDSFYFVNYCDFRGRVYPKTSILNYLSNDLPRSLLEFGEGKPIANEKAEEWLAIHGANCYAEKIDGIGLDKAPFAKRLIWVKENEANIVALGSREGDFWELSPELEAWWLKADKPWGFLAWAHEWARYKANPIEHISHLPVEVDGSSNGYQHMAALLRSRNIAEWVNLTPTETPQDIYTLISNNAADELDGYPNNGMTIEQLYENHCELKRLHKSKDIESNQLLDDIEKNILAISLCGKLPRAAAKKIIMTYPYSATLFTMTNKLKRVKNIFKKWKEEELDSQYALELRSGVHVQSLAPKVESLVARILTKILCGSIDNTFPEVPCLLKWFKMAGSQAASDRKRIQWCSPTGFVVQQVYEKMKPIPISVLGKEYSSKEKTGQSDSNKHSSALAPNFIHSCDAAHMMRTVNSAWESGVTSFRMIHDSYATHAADMETLYRILREEFVAIYQNSDLLSELRENLLSETKGCSIEPAQLKDDFEITEVMDAKYFFA